MFFFNKYMNINMPEGICWLSLWFYLRLEFSLPTLLVCGELSTVLISLSHAGKICNQHTYFTYSLKMPGHSLFYLNVSFLLM